MTVSIPTAGPYRAKRHHVPVGAGAARLARLRPAVESDIYRRRRWVAAVAVTMAIGLGGLAVNGVLVGSGGVPASAAGAGTGSPGPTSVRAERGDTLWSIAVERHGEIGLQRYIDALVDLNGGTTAIAAGQLVRLP